MNAVIYCRVSTAEQTKNLSLPTQKAACKGYCERHGHRVVKTFVEAGESAKTTERPELQRLLGLCLNRSANVGVLVVYNLSRLTRNVVDHGGLRVLLTKAGVQLRSVTEQIDETASGQLMENIVSAFAQYDNNQKAERTKAGMIAALEKGRWTHQAPLGYHTGSRGGPSLLPDDARAELIRVAFDLVAEGVEVREVLTRIVGLGLRTRKGKGLSAQSLHSLLRNPLYAARIETAWGVSAPGDFEPLVAPALFDAVQQELSRRGGRRKVSHRWANPDFPLRRFIRCRKCDGGLTASWSRGRSRRYAYYSCHRCGSVRVRGQQLEDQFIGLLEDLKPEPKYLSLFEAIVRDVWEKRRERSRQDTVVAEARVSELKDRLVRLDEKRILDESIDLQSYRPLRDKLRADLACGEAAVLDACFEDIDLDVALAASEHVLSHAAELWRGATLEQRQRLQVAVFPNGLVYDGENFGTAVTCIALSRLRGNNDAGNGMASPTGFEPVSQP